MALNEFINFRQIDKLKRKMIIFVQTNKFLKL